MSKSDSRNFTNFVEEKIIPVAAKLGANRGLVAIRDGITLAMPLIIVGSVFLIISSFPITAWTNWLTKTGLTTLLSHGSNLSFGIMGLIAVYGIAHSFAQSYGVEGKGAGVVALSSFLIATPTITTGGKNILTGIDLQYMGSKGLFVAIVLGLTSAWVYQWFVNHHITIKLPDTVPPAVGDSFVALIPGAVILAFWLIIFGVLSHFNLNIHDILLDVLSKPLGLLGDTLGGTLIAILLNSAFWFVGIHGGNVVNTILSPIWLMNTDANRLAFQAGKTLPNIITQPFIDNFVYMGGSGATIGLVIVIMLLSFKKNTSTMTKTMAPITFVPGLFNINEPTMFGLPVVLNISLIVPFILAPMCNAIITYTGMSLGIVHNTIGITIPWTMPPLISGFLATGGHISGSIVQLICILVDCILYYPFYKIVEKENKDGIESI
ncbi:PTS sugar transporter subunit IIC [Liquorilactobacillus mali]|uniref:PTS sugar transporter subunit IIC n=1 Tax=Liquorilactobacillus mali TaxID=1618 RepID=UPI00234FC93A|nr:PTS sugar transporter subunit IIC [Liquorilactobacillus mali]MDC7952253.1 PTS sugar transporter subunit IIC [Liquorilactobacillus mali]MDN7145129.1 PTS sugar transporter subunit IIC [Liquorilactobacillus mali]